MTPEFREVVRRFQRLFELYFVVRIEDQGLVMEARSPVANALRWWARRTENLGIGKTNASRIAPLIDGEAYFARALQLFNGATSHIYIASWSFWLDTALSGEPGGGGTMLSTALQNAAARGVQVHILLDYYNGVWAEQILQRHMRFVNVHFKIYLHPDSTVGQAHSAHEKFICVDTRSALVGGIDFMPDRYSPRGHGWRANNAHDQSQSAARGVDGSRFATPYVLWHDTAVDVEGSVVRAIESDFARRWNGADALPPQLTGPTFTSSGSNHNVQFVKTDCIGIHFRSTTLIPHLGTWDAYSQAILEARHYVYIENQYVNYEGLADALVAALTRNVALQVIIVLPFVTEEAAQLTATRVDPAYLWTAGARERNHVRERAYLHMDYLQATLVRRLRAAAAARVGIFELAGCVDGSPEMIYPHSKSMIVDDTWAIIGSANTNGRSFVSDSEANIVIHDRATVTRYRTELWEEHLGVSLPTRRIREFGAEWRRLALSPRDSPDVCTCGELATVHAVQIQNVREGQRYDGPLDWTELMDDQV